MGLGDRDSGGPVPVRMPTTRWSLIREARDTAATSSREALNQLCEAYWRPVFSYMRAARSLPAEDARDLTQAFFVEILERNMLQRYAPSGGSFRAYLRGAIRYFLLDEHEKAVRLKRGGGLKILNLEGLQLPASQEESSSPEETFDREWLGALLDHALADLKEESTRTGRELSYRILERYELRTDAGTAPTHAELARELGIAEPDVAVHLKFCRRRLRKLVADRIRDYVDSEREAGIEFGWILGRLRGSLGREE